MIWKEILRYSIFQAIIAFSNFLNMEQILFIPSIQVIVAPKSPFDFPFQRRVILK